MPRVAKEKPTCSVCFDPFNKTTHSPTTCPHCGIQICRTCFQTYLLNDINDVPRCVNVECTRGWERNFLDNEMTATFRLKTYKEHREKLLADKEKAKLPATQEDAAAMREAKDVTAAAKEKLDQVSAEYRRLLAEVDACHRHLHNLNEVVESHGRIRMPAPGERLAQEKPKQQAAAFIKPCPAEDCKGFLSTAWKCGLCSKYTCPDCLDLKGLNREDPDHTCDPTKVETARLIAKEAKSCPKCGVSICKIEGCDLMWCTHCNTGFSWRTGKMSDGPVHNPHYFEWLRSQGRDTAAAANPMANCGQQQDRAIMTALFGGTTDNYMYYTIRHSSQFAKRSEVERYIAECWRLMREAEDTARVDNADTEEKLRVMRVKYMLGTLSEDDWKTQLQRSEKDMRFKVAKAQVSQVFAAGVREIITPILNPDHNKSKIHVQLVDLVKYCNTCYEQNAKQFGRKLRPIVVLEPPKVKERRESE